MKDARADTRLILLVEDSPEDYEAVVRGFQKAGLVNPIHRCADGDEALEFLYPPDGGGPRRRPSLILLDLNLPGTDGRQVLARIKADPGLRSIPVIVLTTSDDIRDVEQCYSLGANSFVQKPVSVSAFMETLLRLKDYWLDVVILPPETASPTS